MKRVTLFSGHFGSGKTNLAVNYAEMIAAAGLPVSIADLDIVNPYFRTKDSEAELKARGIELISLPYANSNVDLPSLPSEAYGLFERRDRYAVIDLGGDDRGALALGRFTPYILEENDFEMIFTVNFYRPLTRTPEDAYDAFLEIAAVSGVPFTAIVNNSNLGEETTAEHILRTVPLAWRFSELAGVPVLMTSASERIRGLEGIPDLFPMKLQEKYYL